MVKNFQIGKFCFQIISQKDIPIPEHFLLFEVFIIRCKVSVDLLHTLFCPFNIACQPFRFLFKLCCPQLVSLFIQYSACQILKCLLFLRGKSRLPGIEHLQVVQHLGFQLTVFCRVGLVSNMGIVFLARAREIPITATFPFFNQPHAPAAFPAVYDPLERIVLISDLPLSALPAVFPVLHF